MLLLFGDSKTKMARKPRRVKDEEEKKRGGSRESKTGTVLYEVEFEG